jgi:hypothetical protein
MKTQSISICTAPEARQERNMTNRIGKMVGASLASLLLPAGTALAAGVALPTGQAGVALPALNSASAAMPAVPAATMPAMPTMAVASTGQPATAATLPGLDSLNADTQASASGSPRAIRPIRVPGSNIIIVVPPPPGT